MPHIGGILASFPSLLLIDDVEAFKAEWDRLAAKHPDYRRLSEFEKLKKRRSTRDAAVAWLRNNPKANVAAVVEAAEAKLAGKTENGGAGKGAGAGRAAVEPEARLSSKQIEELTEARWVSVCALPSCTCTNCIHAAGRTDSCCMVDTRSALAA